jgi:D-glycero-alpha-D-manno-heptose-7-phosphate kinase
MLFFTGLSRIASDIAKSKIENLRDRSSELNTMKQMVNEAIDILQGPDELLHRFGELLGESWQYKRTLSDKVSTPRIDQIYDDAIKAGAVGGKILGAGGGGFLLLYVDNNKHERVKTVMKEQGLVHTSFKFDFDGSRIVYDGTHF